MNRAAALAGLIGLIGGGSAVIPAAGASHAAVITTTSPATIHCHARSGLKLPDPHCTPGATYAKVNQQDIRRTICKKGWTSTVRPPEAYTAHLKIVQIRQYGYKRRNPHLYEEDHLIPLELGGSPKSVKNLWPEFDNGHIPNPKDKVENALHRAVCDGRVRLAPAQRAIARNWMTAERTLGLTK